MYVSRVLIFFLKSNSSESCLRLWENGDVGWQVSFTDREPLTGNVEREKVSLSLCPSKKAPACYLTRTDSSLRSYFSDTIRPNGIERGERCSMTLRILENFTRCSITSNVTNTDNAGFARKDSYHLFYSH